MDASRNYPLEFPNNFDLHDFIDDPNFDQFIALIRGENEDAVPGLDYELINGCFVDKQISATPDGDAFGFDATSGMVPDPNFIFNALSCFDGEIMKDGEEDNNNKEENSSGATTTTATATKKTKVDRSRTLISERRRARMKEKLHALPSLVPNITKMDKASIIRDAVLYAQGLQVQAKNLKAEIAGLEASLAGSERYQDPMDNPVKTRVVRNSHLICKKI